MPAETGMPDGEKESAKPDPPRERGRPQDSGASHENGGQESARVGEPFDLLTLQPERAPEAQDERGRRSEHRSQHQQERRQFHEVPDAGERLERVMNSIVNGLGVRKMRTKRKPIRSWNPCFYAIFARVHNTL
jgi:hypothetical protein